MINSHKVMNRNMQVHHILMRNEAYIHFGCPKKWGVEQAIQDEKGNVYLRSDVIFALQEKDREVYYFLEIDYMQKMVNNKKKVERYAQVKAMNLLQPSLGYFPQLFWVTTSEHRKKKLIQMCREQQLQHIVYTIDEIR